VQKSEFFLGLASMYEAEIDDLLTDSDGKNVLAKRLKNKRDLLTDLLPMMDYAPEMVVPVFLDAFTFSDAAGMHELLSGEPDDGDFPGWSSIASTIQVADWAKGMVQVTLNESGGDTFLAVAAGLEFLRHHELSRAKVVKAAAADSDPRPSRPKDANDENDDSEDDRDLAESGEDWMANQGFDKLDA